MASKRGSWPRVEEAVTRTFEVTAGSSAFRAVPGVGVAWPSMDTAVAAGALNRRTIRGSSSLLCPSVRLALVSGESKANTTCPPRCANAADSSAGVLRAGV